MKSRSRRAVESRSVCPENQFYDGVVGACSSCADVCSIPGGQLFCINNCAGYYAKYITGPATSGWLDAVSKRPTSRPTSSRTASLSSSVVVHGDFDRLIDKPLFWTSIVSMVIALSATVGIIVLCVIRWRAAGRRRRYRTRWGRISRSVGSIRSWKRPLAKDDAESQASSVTKSSSPLKQMDKGNETEKFASDKRRGGTSESSKPFQYDNGRREVTTMTTDHSLYSLRFITKSASSLEHLSFAKGTSGVGTLPRHFQSPSKQDIKTVASSVTRCSDIPSKCTGIKCDSVSTVDARVSAVASVQQCEDTSVKQLSTNVASPFTVDVSISSDSAVPMYRKSALPLVHWPGFRPRESSYEESKFVAAPISLLSDAGYRSDLVVR